jgi:uncharacterized membrane protein
MSNRNRVKVVSVLIALVMLVQQSPVSANAFATRVQSVQAAAGPVGDLMAPLLPQVLPATESALPRLATTQAEPDVLANPITISRVQSSYQAGANVVITFTVTNNQPLANPPSIPSSATITETVAALAEFAIDRDPNTIRDVVLRDQLTASATWLASTTPPDDDGNTLLWNLGDLPPQQSRSLTLTLQVPPAAADFTALDSGAAVYGVLKNRTVTDQTQPALLAPDGFAPWLVWTVDAQTDDGVMLQKAAELGQDPTTLFEYVRSIDYEAYTGSLRGTRGTLWSEAGNSADQASLLIAMLRASGTPARYRHGTLTTGDAQQLIAAMFPTPTQIQGNVPPGSEVSDPVNDPDLIAEVQDHWWVEAYLSTTGWTDLDPSFANAAIGDSFAAAATDGTDRIAELPDNIRHKLNLTLKVEQVSQFPITGAGFDVSYPLTATYSAVELVGQPLNLGFWVESQALGGMVYATYNYTYVPYFRIGTGLRLLVGHGFQESLSSFPLGSYFVTGIWLQVEQQYPDGTRISYERIIKDLIGPEARQAGGSFPLPPRGGSPLLNEADIAQLQIVPQSFVPESEVSRLEGAMAALSPDLAQAHLAYQDIDPQDLNQAMAYLADHLETIETAQMLMLDLLGTQFNVMTTSPQREYGAQSLFVKSYPDQPKLVLMTQTSISNTVSTSFELLNIRERAIAYPGQPTEAVYVANLTRTMVDKAIEYAIAEALLGPHIFSAFATLAAADEMGIPHSLITAANLGDLDDLGISDEAKARITAATGEGMLIYVPDDMVVIDGQPTIGWLEIDDAGYASFVAEDGCRAQEAINYAEILEFVSMMSGKAGFMGGFTATILVFFAEYLIAAASPSMDFGTIGNALALLQMIQTVSAAGIASCAGTPPVGYPDCLFGVSTAVSLILAFTLVPFDPTLSPYWYSFETPAGLEPTAVAPVAFAPTHSGAQGSGAVETEHLIAHGAMTLSWSDDVRHGFSSNALEAASASLYDGSTWFGSGNLSLDTPTQVSLQGNPVAISLAAGGSQSFFAPLVGGLGAGTDWISYTAQLTATQPYTLTLLDTTVLLDSDIYTGTLTAVIDGATQLSGVGHGPLPQFSPGATLQVQAADLNFGPLTGAITVGGQPFVADNGLAIAGFSGPLMVTESTADVDLIEFSGPAEFFTLNLDPAASTIDPTQAVVLTPQVAANYDDTYTLTVEAPEGWDVAIDSQGAITARPPAGAPAGSCSILVSAQAGQHPNLFVSALHPVTVVPFNGLSLAVLEDDHVTVPMGTLRDPEASIHGAGGHIVNGQAEVPSAAYTINLTNTSNLVHTFDLTISGLPAGWVILSDAGPTTATTLVLEAGEVGQLGLYISPILTTLVAPGTSYPFEVTATAQDNGALSQTEYVEFIMPGLSFAYPQLSPEVVYAAPGDPAEFVLSLTNVGNIAGTLPYTASLRAAVLRSASLSPTLITSPLTGNTSSLEPGSAFTTTVTLTTTGVSIGETYWLLATTASGEYRPAAYASLFIASHNTAPVYQAADSCTMGSTALPAALVSLALAMTDLESSCNGSCDLAQRDAVVAAARSVAHYARLTSDHLTADDIDAAVDSLAGHTDPADITVDLAALGAAVSELSTQLCALEEHLPAARFTPYLEAALPGQTVTYTLDVENQGNLVTTYAITLELPTGTSSFTETLNPGDTFTAPVSVATTTLALHTLQAGVVVVGLPSVADSAEAHLNVVDRFVQVTAVTADPDFVETGTSSTTLSVDVTNVANVPREANARTTMLAPTGGISWTADIPLNILAGAPRSYELGTVDTSGWAAGVYTLTVDLLDGAEVLIPDGHGYSYLAVGQALIASHTVRPDLVAPGTVTVTTIVTTEITADTIGDNEPLALAVTGPAPQSFEYVIADDAPPSLVASGPEPTILASATPEAPAPAHEPVIPSLPLSTDDPMPTIHSPMPNPQPPTSNLQPPISNPQSPISIQSTFTRTEQDDPAFTYAGTWSNLNYHRASGGSYYRADTAGETAALTFSGTWVNVGFLGSRYSGQAEIVIDGASRGVLDLYQREDTALSFVYDGLISATHTLSVTALGAQNPYASSDYIQLDYVDAWDGSVLADGTFEQNDPRVLLSAGWNNYNDATASGGSYVLDELGTAWFPFSGDSFDFHAVLRSGNGWARLYVDGHYLTTLQPYHYSTTIMTRTYSYEGFGAGPHILQVSTYRANATVDAFSTPGTAPFDDPDPVGSYTRYEEDHPAWLYNGQPFTQTAQSWSRTDYNVADRSSSDQVIGSDTISDVAQITVSGEWRNLGFGADWNSGQAEIYLDGVSQGTIDLYRRERGVVNQVFAGLANTSHTISVTVSGDGEVWIDYLDVWDGSALPSGTFKDYPDGDYYRSGGWGYNTYPQDHWYSDNGTIWFPFEGDTVSYSYLGNTNSGRARIYVDQAYLGLFDLYGNPAMTQTLSFDGLGAGAHILRVESYRDRLTFDAFKRPGASPFYTPTVETGIIRYEEDDPLWLYNDVPYTQTATTWTRSNVNLADRSSDDQIIGSSTAADVAQITVSGEWLNLGFAADSSSGQAEIYLDGVSQGIIDLYRHDYSVVSRVFPGLVNTSHTLSVTVIGDGSVWIDYLDVWDGTAEPEGTFYHPAEGFYTSAGWGYATWPLNYYYSDNGRAWFPFTGDSVSYNYVANTNSGLVKIYLDEQCQGVFDLYGGTIQTQTLSFDGLGAGAHVLRLEQYRGRATLESFQTPGSSPFYTPTVKTGVVRYEEDDPALRYDGLPYTQTVGTWSIGNNPNYGSSAYYAGTSTVGDSVSLSFEGTWFGVGFLTHDYGGQADIYLDGSWLRTVDLYTNEPDTASYYFDSLLDTTHTVSVTLLATAHPNSRGNRLRFDYFDVWDGTDIPQGTFEESSERVIYSGGWSFGSSAAASGGGYAGDDGANNGTVWFPFTGESVTYQALAHYTSYNVIVRIDGVSRGRVDIYSEAVVTRPLSFDGLDVGPHVMEIRAYLDDTTVDAFVTPGSPPWHTTPPPPTGIVRYEEDNPALLYNGYPFTQTVYTWSPGTYAYYVASNGWYAASGAAGAWVSLDFSGTWVGVGFTKSTGEARILIDGSPVVTLDLSLESDVTNVYFDDLISGSHTISVERVSGSVYFDFFDTWDGTDMGDGWFEAKLDDHRGPYYYNTLNRWYTRYPDYNNTRIQYARDADVLARRFPPGYPTHLWFTFAGDDLLFLPFQSNGGSTEVFIDGVSQGVVDLTPEYSTQPYALHFQDLGEGPHVARVNASIAYVDAFQVDPPAPLPYTPVVEWQDLAPTDFYSSTYSNHGLLSSAALGDLDGDGLVEIVIPSSNGQLYVYRGDGQDAGGGSPIIWQSGLVGAAAEPALADLDGDGNAEIIVMGSDGTAAFHHDGSVYWFTDTIKSGYSEGGYWGWGGPSIGNVDLEPGPEIVLAASNDGLYVLDHDGALLYHTATGLWPTVPTLADLTGDGILDIVYAQNQTISLLDYANGANIEWTRTHTYTGYGLGTFGAPAVADVDGQQPGGDDGPEVIINWGSYVDVLDEDGSLLWNYALGPSYYRPSPITIADVDGDGEIEILTASALHVGFWVDYHTLFVLNADGTLLWQQNMGDTSASASGVATQDLDGDGVWEVLWNGLHEGFTIMNGPDGTKLFNEQFTESGTILDYPTLGDVDGDGFAEVVAGGVNGLFVIGHDGIWTMSRPIWNQHNYHITNINDDWSVPANEPNSWEVYNTYRTQTPERTPAPSYLVSLTYTAGITGVLVLTDTASLTLTATPPEYAWSYRQDWYEPVVTTTFDSRLTDMRPGEARLVAQGTEVAYRLPSGYNYLTLPPLYASAPHIVSVEPASQTVALGGEAVYTLILSNPAASSDVYTLSVAGLPAGWATHPRTVTLPAGAEVSVPLTISVPADTDPASLAFSVVAANGAGATDLATAALGTFDALDLALEPASIATTGLSGVFTLTLTNLDDAPQTIHLVATGLADVSLPASVVVPSDTSASLSITATATANGPQPFTVIGTSDETGASDWADAVLEILGRRDVALGLSPAVGVGGPGTPAVYTLSVMNTGTLADTYDLAVSLPPGWSYRLEANGTEVDSLSLSPHVFNAADLLLIVTPANGAAPGFYDVSATAQSRANPAVSAVVTGSLEVTARGVGVDIQPQSGTIDPTQVNTWQVTVTNLGTVADSYVLTATGLVALSAQFTPETVALNPGQSQAVQLTASDLSFALPGTYEFAVWARSQADSRIQNEDRAEFTLGSYEAVEAAWIPTSQTVTDTLMATFLLVVTNTGNLLTTYQFAVDAPSLSSELRISELPIPPSTVAALPVTMRAMTSGTYVFEGSAISDDGLASASATATLTVVLPEQPLSVYAGPDQSSDEGSILGFSGNASKPESSLVAIHWDMGDGATITGTLTLTYTYADDGAYPVTLTVTDTLGARASDGLTVTVSNVAPTVDAGPDQVVDVGQPVSYVGIFTDPGVLDVHTIEWAFGDGITVSGTLTPTHTYSQSDLYTVTLTVTDDDGGVGSDILVVTVERSSYSVYLPIIVR